ncbi:hypothetical protein C4Q31_03495 [Leptospira borgpetersenii serovar Ceylonica]|uniref:Uncharacterized protein n=3 Tax=Leptospira borgpetersenii TaxID=174 RepID=M3GSN6_LEPBO|nr:hypothetical protein LBBP_02173 [Leptospira borgpetersenii serovar Ballum]AXX14759.1 hypothetical protein C4Q31_03495 [Leptospira borgpetersenii serovar Ceylonica]EKR00241.1 hypothetical protein LEP1GSC121_3735 [Leptospira borgpetersenii serovar Castellonis str. 200801910]EMF97853.1 hypothetical protein LEP1GSC123_4097 [Leptospira borgpetersenii str. 200701203]EMN19178.1 hypothetical protein LEP1GSC056_1931 [Leptospira borgpetersenii str. Brem 328]EMO09952.1 hypothetical protein LEP1GSC137_
MSWFHNQRFVLGTIPKQYKQTPILLRLQISSSIDRSLGYFRSCWFHGHRYPNYSSNPSFYF